MMENQNALPSPKRNSARRKRRVILFSVLAAAGLLAAWFAVSRTKAENAPKAVSCTVLGKTTLNDTVSVTGTIHSEDPCSVYSTLSYPVKKVSVSAGDTVKKGDVLASLDSSSLDQDIRQQEYTVSYASKSAALALEKAKSDYESALYLYNHDLSSDVASARSNLENARSALDAEKEVYSSSQYSYEQGQISRIELNQEKAKLDQAQVTYDTAEKAVESAKRTSQQSLLAAKTAYEDASAKSADKSAQAALDKLRDSQRDCVITAPRSGTVTFVGASVGSPPSGVLFKIENPEDLIVDAEIKEADTARADPGDSVSIKTDATGDQSIEGKILSIAPAADPKTEGTGNVTYPVKVRVSRKDQNLKIGMRAKLSITLEQKKGVYAVPYESLADNAGGYAVYAAKKSGNDWKVEALPVTLGLQTDISAEIAGRGLKDGLAILTSTDGVQPGEAVKPAFSSPAGGSQP